MKEKYKRMKFYSFGKNLSPLKCITFYFRFWPATSYNISKHSLGLNHDDIMLFLV